MAVVIEDAAQSTRLSIRGVGAVDPVAQQRLQQRPHRKTASTKHSSATMVLTLGDSFG
jgi:hypothetical protein